jgi:hypothetical protein
LHALSFRAEPPHRVKMISTFKQLLRTHKNSANPLVRRGIKFIYSFGDIVGNAKIILKDRESRSLFLLKTFSPGKLHQTTTMTEMNRYPEIFAACRKYFGDKEDLRILSFGCSTGEEVLTLRQYFPTAAIIGAEINPLALAACKKLDVDERTIFVRSDAKTIESLAPFDAIFCMAVLQRTPHRVATQGVKSLKDLYPFEKFDRQIAELHEYVKTGGLLIVHHTQYFFGDSSVVENYEPLENSPTENAEMPKFDCNSNRVENPLLAPSIFVKKRG